MPPLPRHRRKKKEGTTSEAEGRSTGSASSSPSALMPSNWWGRPLRGQVNLFRTVHTRSLNIALHAFTFPVLLAGVHLSVAGIPGGTPERHNMMLLSIFSIVQALYVTYCGGGMGVAYSVCVLLPIYLLHALSLGPFRAHAASVSHGVLLFFVGGLLQILVGHRTIEGQFPRSLPATATVRDRLLFSLHDIVFGAFVLWSSLLSSFLGLDNALGATGASADAAVKQPKRPHEDTRLRITVASGKRAVEYRDSISGDLRSIPPTEVHSRALPELQRMKPVILRDGWNCHFCARKAVDLTFQVNFLLDQNLVRSPSAVPHCKAHLMEAAVSAQRYNLHSPHIEIKQQHFH